jgi:hypothetical protein
MTTTKTRGRNLDDQIIEVIVGLLDGWTGKLTWELLIDAVAERTRSIYSRQALYMHERIRMAYQLRKAGLATSINQPQKAAEKLSTVEVEKLLERLNRLSAENTRLKMENERFSEQFAVWAYNAHSRGIPEAFLSRPLPAIDREQTRTQPTKLHRKK